jgi:hypothetical protein
MGETTVGDDPAELTPPRRTRRRDEGVRSTRRPRSASRGGGPPAAIPPGTSSAAGPAEVGADDVDGPAIAAETSVVEDVDPLAPLRERLKAEAGVGSAAAAMPSVEAVTRLRVAEDDRRRQLWRDSATLLIGVVLALLVGQAFFPAPVVGPTSSPTPLPSSFAIGSFGQPVTLPPGATIGPIINPSLPIDASPTPIPVITMAPPTPSPSPSPAPSASTRPTPKPSPKPSVKPPTPPPATAPPPTAQFTWSVTLLTVDFTSTSTGDTSWSWDFGDGGTATAENPSHTYPVTADPPNTYTVTLTVTGPGGTDAISHNVTVPPPP